MRIHLFHYHLSRVETRVLGILVLGVSSSITVDGPGTGHPEAEGHSKCRVLKEAHAVDCWPVIGPTAPPDGGHETGCLGPNRRRFWGSCFGPEFLWVVRSCRLMSLTFESSLPILPGT